MSSPAVSIKGVAKSFGSVEALKGVSFDVPRQSIFGLLGPNGAGKTTLFSVIAHFLKADTGNVEVLGIDVRNISKLQGRMTILPQDALFQKNVPILDQLAFFRQLDGSSKADALKEVETTLEMVGLTEYMKRGVHALSHGMIKRLGLAQAFLGNPEVILLDEPTSGLDPKNAAQIRELIRDFHSKDATVVVSSHNLGEIQELCDHVAILTKGELRVCDTVDAITRGGRQLDLTFSQPLSKDEGEGLEKLPGVRSLERTGRRRYTLTVDLKGRELDDVIESVLRFALEAGNMPHAISEGNSLEEVFLQMTED